MTSLPAREHLRALLATHLPEWKVLDNPRELDAAVNRPTLVVWVSSIRRRQLNRLGTLQCELETWVLTPESRSADTLETALVSYLEVLEEESALTWEEAEHGVLGDAFHGYRVPVTMTLTI